MMSTPEFRKAHSRRLRKINPYVLTASFEYNSTNIQFCSLDKEGTVIDKFTLPTIDVAEDSYLRLLNACLELVCMYNDANILLLNPTTKEVFVLPHDPVQEAKDKVVGFGYVESTKKYKIICIFASGRCRVFTLGVDREWRTAPNPPIRPRFKSTAFVDGAIHICTTYTRDYRDYGVHIYRFDLEREEWLMIQDPPMGFLSFVRDIVSICELGGHLCIVENNEQERKSEVVFGIWLLKDGMWVKEYEIALSRSVVSSAYCIPLAIEEDGRILVKTSENSENRVRYFDKNGKSCGEIEVPEKAFTAALYKGSSISIEGQFK